MKTKSHNTKIKTSELQNRNKQLSTANTEQSAAALKTDQIPATQIPTAAPSVTIAPRNPARGVIIYVVTLTDFKAIRSYPCRSLDKALTLATRFISGVVNSKPQTTDQVAAETFPETYNGPARTAEQVAA